MKPIDHIITLSSSTTISRIRNSSKRLKPGLSCILHLPWTTFGLTATVTSVMSPSNLPLIAVAMS